MASLPPLTGYNLGGIDQFWFIPVDDVQSIPDEESNVIEQDIQLVGDAKFSVGYATQETLQFTENQNRDAQGNFYEQSLSGFYPKDQENIASLFEGMAAERFIVIFRDNNGYYKLLGSLANPCKFTATYESGDSANGRNGYSFEFTRTDVEKAPFYRGIINETEKVINTDPCAGLEKPVRQTYTLTFEANSAKYNALTIEQAGTIQQIDAPSGTTVYKAISTSPFQQQVSTGDSVAEGDILQVELDAKPTAKETVEVVVSFSDIQERKTLPDDLGGNAQYLYIVNHDDATVSCVDTVQGAEIATIPMPAGYSTGDIEVKIVYRFYEKEVFVFYRYGRLNFIIIDADPASANFNSIKSGPNNAGVGRVRGERVGYVQTKDYFVTVQEKNYSVFDKNQVFLSNYPFFTNWGVTSTNNSFLLGSYLFGNSFNGPKQIIDTSKETAYTLIKDFGGVKTGSARFNPNNNLLYYVDSDPVAVIEPYTWTLVAYIGDGTDRGSCDIDLDNNIVLAVTSAGYNRKIQKIDADTNTFLGSENLSEAMDQIFWSRASGLFYTRKRGTDQLFVYDATKSPGSMKVNQITVGKTPVTNYQNNPCACINQIML